MFNLTEEEFNYIQNNGLTVLDIYDGRGKSKKECHDNAKKNDCRLYFGSPCLEGGHRIRTRSGHCAVCSPAALAFQERYNNSGLLYVASNNSYTKVGVVDNNINCPTEAIHNREIRLNLDGGYGGMDGWEIRAWTPIAKNVGNIEHKVHNELTKYSVIKDYYYSGEYREAQELFSCEPSVAIETINALVKPSWSFLKS